MAVYSIPDLIIRIDTFIVSNGNGNITGIVHNQILNDVVDSLEAVSNNLSNSDQLTTDEDRFIRGQYIMAGDVESALVITNFFTLFLQAADNLSIEVGSNSVSLSNTAINIEAPIIKLKEIGVDNSSKLNRCVNADGTIDWVTVLELATDIVAAYDSEVSVVSQVEAEAGTSTTVRRWTAQRVKQAIAAIGGGAAFGKFAIYDSAGVPTFYTDLQPAINAGSVGDVVKQLTNVTETGNVTVAFKNGVDINFNGFTYTLNTATTATCFTGTSLALDVNLYNGKIIRAGGGAGGSDSMCLILNATTVNAHTMIMKNTGAGQTVQSFFSGAVLNGGYYENTSYIIGIDGAILKDITFNGFGRVQFSTKGDNIKSRSTGSIGIDAKDGILNDSYGYSGASYGVTTSNGKIHRTVGESDADIGLYGVSSNCEMYDSEGISTADYGLWSGGSIVERCKGGSSANTGLILALTTTVAKSCIAFSSAANAFIGNIAHNCTATCTWNNAGGSAFRYGQNNSEFINCFGEVAHTSAYALNGLGVNSATVVNIQGKGMNTLTNIGSQLQTNPTDSFGNILIG